MTRPRRVLALSLAPGAGGPSPAAVAELLAELRRIRELLEGLAARTTRASG